MQRARFARVRKDECTSLPDMKAKQSSKVHSREQLECDALRLLCSHLVKPGTRMEICRLLQPGDFLDSVRRAAFEEVLAAGFASSRQLRASLRARVVNRGFPHYDLDKLLASKLVSETEIEELFESTLLLVKLGGWNDPSLSDSGANEQG